MRWGTVIGCAAVATVCGLVLMWSQPAGSGSSDKQVIQAAAQSVAASVPPLIRFSAAAPNLRSSTQNMTFSLYDSAQSTVALWSETQQVEVDEQGNYTVMLGATRPEGLPVELFTSGQALWLVAQIAGEAEQPRSLLVAVPYAFKAAEAETLGGLPASAFLLAPQAGQAPAPSTQPAGTTATGPGVVAPSMVASPAGAGKASARAASSARSVPATSCSVTSDGTGKQNQLAKFSTTPCIITKSAVFESAGKVGIGTTAPAGTLDVVGGALVRGTLQLPARGRATATAGFNSQAEDWQASVFNKSSAGALTEHLLLLAEPVGNDTATPSAKLSLLSATGNAIPAETGLSISNKGLIKFAAGQTFPGAGTITGVTAGTDLSGGGTSGKVTLNLNTALTDARYARLAAANSFTASQKIAGSLTATVASGTAITGNGPTGVLGHGASGGTGVSATGGSNFSSPGTGGAGVRAQGGAAATDTVGERGGDGLVGTGGDGFTAGSGGNFLGGSAANASSGFGGNGITTTGGVADLVGGTGGFAVSATGGAGFRGGLGVSAFGGPGATGGFGGIGVSADGGSSDAVSGFGGTGIDASGGLGATPGLAGSFSGDVSVNGTLTATTLVATNKDFKIDNPVDPTKYLFHASVESSEMINIYSGVAVMNRKGEASVMLPRWFEALNGDFRYQLTCIGAWAPVFIAREIDHNQFVIAGGTPGMKVSWQVTGVRHDAAAKAHPLIVEMAKNDDLFYKRDLAQAKLARRPSATGNRRLSGIVGGK